MATSSETKIDSLEKILKERNTIKKQMQTEQKKKDIVVNKINASKKVEQLQIPEYKIPLSLDLQKYIYKLSKSKGLPYEMTLAVIKTESNFNPKLSHRNGNGTIDKGLFQINSVHKKWCKELGITDLYNPYQNTKIGIELLSSIYKKYPNMHKALMVYNMGEFGAKRNWKTGRGSTNYSRKVINNINIISYCK
jgi:soluble lytic murein transglycosylase-like protein